MSTSNIITGAVYVFAFLQLSVCALTYFTAIATTILKAAGFKTLSHLVDLFAMIVCATTMFVVTMFTWDVAMPDYEGAFYPKLGALLFSVFFTWYLVHVAEQSGKYLLEKLHATAAA